MSDHVLLVNANRIRPPIAPIALDYLASMLTNEGVPVRVLDLMWSEDEGADLDQALAERPVLVGLTFRNLDDCSYPSGESFLDEHAQTVAAIHERTDAPVVVGGSGASITPAAVLRRLGADYCIGGEGEAALVRLARALAGAGDVTEVPGLAYRCGDAVRENRRASFALATMGVPRRAFVDNERYFAEGGQIGFETVRGCDGTCTYCADPILRGAAVRPRPPHSIAAELESLVARGIDVFQTCDCEFNVLPGHASRVCAAIVDAGLSDRMRWYAYCRPDRFDARLAALMKRAGCAGINFGVDHTEEAMLEVLGRSHRFADVSAARAICRDNGIAVMFDLIFGAPNETRDTIRSAIEALRDLSPEAVGIAFGLRLYRGTPLADELAPVDGRDLDGVHGASGDLLEPAFYVEPSLGDDVGAWLGSLVAGDPRFFYLGAPESPDTDMPSYNYNANTALTDAIRAGAKGAYWDILRKLRQ